MVEIEQEELERLKGFEEQYNTLKQEHDELNNKHAKLKDDYIELSKGQQLKSDNKGNTDPFDEICKEKFGK